MSYGCKLTRISISRIFDKAEWNCTMWAEGSRDVTSQSTSTDALIRKEIIALVSHEKRNDQDCQHDSLSPIKLIAVKNGIGIQFWKICLPCFFVFFKSLFSKVASSSKSIFLINMMHFSASLNLSTSSGKKGSKGKVQIEKVVNINPLLS